MAEPTEMPFGMWTQMRQRKHVLDGVQVPKGKGVILRLKSGRSRTYLDMSDSRYTQSDSVGGSTGTAWMPTEAY